jgi:hypothetical protein
MAFAFSIIPAFKGQVDQWFGTLLNACFVFFTLNVLEAIVYGQMMNFEDIFNNPIDVWQTSNSVMSFNVTSIILYLMAFWLTSKFVGKGDGGRVISKAVGVAAAAVGGAAFASGAGGSRGALANTVATSKDAFTPE